MVDARQAGVKQTALPRTAAAGRPEPMFTGLVEHVGGVRSIAPHAGGSRLAIDLGPLAEDASLGASIAVSGACLTITSLSGTVASFDVSAETLRKTTLGALTTGSAVNLERALAFGARLGGHLVSGHVDGIGRLLERRQDGNGERFTFLLPETITVVEKGSLTVDGVSLTTWDCRGARCSIAVIPHTLSVTTLGGLRPGHQVNLEMDLIGRWVERLLADREVTPGAPAP